jgi:hypothetical protein
LNSLSYCIKADWFHYLFPLLFYMKAKYTLGLFLLSAGAASAEGLYLATSEPEEALPLEWTVGANLVYDDNVFPGLGPKESSLAINPYVGLSFLRTTSQTTWDVYARLGLIYYFDAPAGMDDINSQSRVGANLTHSVTERLRFTSRNFISYELEPDYSYGIASGRSESGGENLFWQVDNSIGYRMTERLGTYTGLRLTELDSDVDNSDRFTWSLYNQFRYQLRPQTVLTTDYRYAATAAGGTASDSNTHYLLVGTEHRFNQNTLGIVNIGAQLRDADQGESSNSPYLELALNSKVTQELTVRGFARYGLEDYDTVQEHPDGGLVEFDDRTSFRLGISGTYVFSPIVSFFSGLDYIPSSYEGARSLGDAADPSLRDLDEDLFNAYIGVTVRIMENLSGTASYNFTDSSSDIGGKTYSRNRINIGLSTTF